MEMKKIFLLSTAVVILQFCLSSYAETYSGGSGTSTSPYLIATAADINTLGSTSADWNKCFKMIADINMASFTGTQYKIIGNGSTAFTGVFDGNGHKIYKLNFIISTTSYAGFFGNAHNATIKNLGIEDVNLSMLSVNYSGGLIGRVSSCTISDCYITGKITADFIGGLVGYQSNRTIIKNCHSTLDITCFMGAGGLVGGQEGNIYDSYSTGTISCSSGSSSNVVGGLVGAQNINTETKNCYSTVNISSNVRAGGLVGRCDGSLITNCYAAGSINGYCAGGLVGYFRGTIKNCYSTGAVNGTYMFGGLIGYTYNSGVTFQNCFWDTETSLCSNGVGTGSSVGITGKTTAEMKMLATYANAGWSIGDIYGDDSVVWLMMPDGQDYPTFQYFYWFERFAATPPLSGSGTEDDPYQINSAEDFNALGNSCIAWDKYIVLTADINMAGYPVVPIGNAYYKFIGDFNGQGFIIRNVTMDMPNKNYVGLFGRVCNDAVIANLGVEDVNIAGKKLVGGLAGFNSGGTISNCYVTGCVKPNSSAFAGGLIGFSGRGTITDCNADVDIIGSGQNIGGLVGCNAKRNTVFNCFATGTITDANAKRFGSSAGGLVGNNSGKIQQCYADCDITANLNSSSEHFNIGGLAGDNTYGLISHCYANGNVNFVTSAPSTALINTGGVLGSNVYSDVNDCYSTGQITFNCGTETQYIVGGVVGWNLGRTINRCYSTCAIGSGSSPEADYGVGGVAGLDSNSVIQGCFWDIQTSGKTISGGGKGLTTEQMKTMLLYQNAGWTGNGWVMNDGMDYPRLAWENTGGVAIPAEQLPPLTGSGTIEDPYQIWTAADFAYLSWYKSIIDKHFILMADLDLQNVRIHPISEFGPFTGTFNGNGHKIKNVSIYEPAASYTGLFGRVGTGAVIKNLDIKNANIVGGDYTGGLIGKNDGGTISKCGTTGTVDGFTCVGGLIGKNTGTIDWCYSTADTTAWEDMTSCVGGLIGRSSNNITYSYATGDVTCRYSSNSYIGGLVGRVYSVSTIQKCYSVGYISATGKNIKKGGLLGDLYPVSIIPPYNPVNITVTSCYWDIQTSGMTTSAGGTGAKGRTTAQMQIPNSSTFTNWSIGDSKWYGAYIAYPAHYPCLSWQLDIPAPDVIAMPQADANNAIIAAGFTVGTITKAYSDSIPVGCVANQNPAPGEKVITGVPINIVISSNISEDGTVITPVLISDVNGLLAMAAAPAEYNKYFILTADINMAGRTFYGAVIAADTDANSTFHGTPFTGIFDGKGHKIKNLRISFSSKSYIGLFGRLNGGTVKNLGLEDLWINGSTNSFYIGGLVGYNYGGSINNCYSTGHVYASQSPYTGGLAGVNLSDISNSYSKCYITLSPYSGGLVGYNTNTGNIRNCYSTGVVSNYPPTIGGLAGYNSGNISDCFWDVNSSGVTTSNGGTGKTTTEMKTLSTFTNAGWDFNTPVWKICDGTNYPKLAWQRPLAGDFVCPDGVDMYDLTVLAGQWLYENSASDINGDSIVNMRDFAKFAENWMNE